MSQTKKIKKWLSQWEQKKVKEVVETPNENAAKEEKSYVKPKMEEYLFGRYDFRFNVLTGVTEYRSKGNGEFEVLDERARNTLFMELRGKEIKCTFSGLLRFVYSSLIEEFHPFHAYCKSLMPNMLQRYYTDKADLSSQGCLEHKLALMGMINLDEFDCIPEQRMAQLKNLMQMPAVTIRQAYKKNFRQLPRIASFIGTSNRLDLLTDPTGSRRFLCVEVKQKIDCSNLELEQVYAQPKAELAAGERHWFTSDEEQEIQERNASFYQVRPEEELLRTHYRAPLPGECSEMLSLVDILAGLRSEHVHLLRRCDMKRFGIILQTLGMEKVHTRLGNRYKVVRV